MSVLLIGGNGFIGSHLVDGLLNKNIHVSVLDVSKDPFRENLPNISYHFGRIEDESILSNALQNIDVVYHLVSTTYPSNSNKNVIYDIESNLIATIKLLDAMRKNDVKRIIYLSSGGTVYGDPNSYPISEDHALSPISSYGIVKVTIEKYLRLYKKLYGFKPLIFRPANVYGPRQRYDKMQGVTSHFIYNSLRDKQIEIWGDGTTRKDYIYVNDLVEVLIKGVEENLTGTFNIGSGRDYSLNEIVANIEQLTGKKLKIKYESSKLFDVQKFRLDIEKIESAIDWTPQTSMETGLEHQITWMKDHLQLD